MFCGKSYGEGENKLGQQARRICDTGTLLLGSVDNQELGRQLRSGQLGSGFYVGLATKRGVSKIVNPRCLAVQWDCQQKWMGPQRR